MSVPRARAGWCRLACRLGGSRGTHRCARAVVRHAQTIGVCVGVSYLQMTTPCPRLSAASSLSPCYRNYRNYRNYQGTIGALSEHYRIDS